ncbi:hypothetical protein [Streptomyces sp. NPDC047525]|uniref:hypothetical protein n=1 Tax=Streptomyces sp. NPDC047525 TaxID=3155264 RepID=UPI0033E30249
MLQAAATRPGRPSPWQLLPTDAPSTAMYGAASAGGAIQDWDDDTEYRSAVGCGRLMIVIALACMAVVIGLVVVGVSGVFGLTEILSVISD